MFTALNWSYFICIFSVVLLLVCVSIGRLGLLDYDTVELSNLHRQVLHGEENQGKAKALSAANAVKRYCSVHVKVQYIKGKPSLIPVLPIPPQ